jgi:hypothetical protein
MKVFHGNIDRVSDPYSFDTVPDPAFLAEYRSGSRVLMTKIGKKLQLKQIKVFFV